MMENIGDQSMRIMKKWGYHNHLQEAIIKLVALWLEMEVLDGDWGRVHDYQEGDRGSDL